MNASIGWVDEVVKRLDRQATAAVGRLTATPAPTHEDFLAIRGELIGTQTALRLIEQLRPKT